MAAGCILALVLLPWKSATGLIKNSLTRDWQTEASAALVRVAFEIEKVNRVEIHCNPRNLANAAVPRKLGFTYEATLRQRQTFLEGELLDLMIWSLFRQDYSTSPAAASNIAAMDAIGRKIIE